MGSTTLDIRLLDDIVELAGVRCRERKASRKR